MYFENELELQAIKAYHNDEWTDEDYETMDMPNPRLQAYKSQREVEMRDLNSEEYEGGNQ